MDAVVADEFLPTAGQRGELRLDLERHLRGNTAGGLDPAVDFQPWKRWQAAGMEQRPQEQRRIGELAVGRGSFRRRRRSVAHLVTHPRADEFDRVSLVREAHVEIGTAGPTHEPVIGTAGPRRERDAEPLEPHPLHLRLHVADRVDHHDALAGRIMEHDLDERERPVGLPVGSHLRHLEEVPGDAISKERQRAGGGCRRVVGMPRQPADSMQVALHPHRPAGVEQTRRFVGGLPRGRGSAAGIATPAISSPVAIDAGRAVTAVAPPNAERSRQHHGQTDGEQDLAKRRPDLGHETSLRHAACHAAPLRQDHRGKAGRLATRTRRRKASQGRDLGPVFCRRQRSLQYRTCSQQAAHFRRHVKGRPHAAQIFSGRGRSDADMRRGIVSRTSPWVGHSVTDSMCRSVSPTPTIRTHSPVRARPVSCRADDPAGSRGRVASPLPPRRPGA